MEQSNTENRQDNGAQLPGVHWGRTGQLLAWGGLIALGARRGGFLGLLAVGYGIERLSSLAFGVSFGQRLLAAATDHQRQAPGQRFGEGTRDMVDEASWESFPASDPPARGVG
jgi:hypothetical protein